MSAPSVPGYDKMSWVTPSVRALPPTRDAQTKGDLDALGLTGLRLMHLNESPYPPSPRAIEAAIATTAELHRYPAVRGQPLANAIAARIGICPIASSSGMAVASLFFSPATSR